MDRVGRKVFADCRKDADAVLINPHVYEERKAMTEVQQNIQKYLEVVTIIQESLKRARIVCRYALSHQIIQDLATKGFLVDHHPEIVPQDASNLHEVEYRGYRIYRDPKPVPPHIAGDWSFVHRDYDGAPDGSDNRCGDAQSIADAKAQIDEQIADRDCDPTE